LAFRYRQNGPVRRAISETAVSTVQVYENEINRLNFPWLLRFGRQRRVPAPHIDHACRTPDDVSLIRLLLRQDSRSQTAAVCDLALFNVALDTCFRGSELVRLRVADVATPLGVREIIDIRQKKTDAHN
jgi:hypothetical protein